MHKDRSHTEYFGLSGQLSANWRIAKTGFNYIDSSFAWAKNVHST